MGTQQRRKASSLARLSNLSLVSKTDSETVLEVAMSTDAAVLVVLVQDEDTAARRILSFASTTAAAPDNVDDRSSNNVGDDGNLSDANAVS